MERLSRLPNVAQLGLTGNSDTGPSGLAPGCTLPTTSHCIQKASGSPPTPLGPGLLNPSSPVTSRAAQTRGLVLMLQPLWNHPHQVQSFIFP